MRLPQWIQVVAAIKMPPGLPIDFPVISRDAFPGMTKSGSLPICSVI
jgi:hypothetical protein